MPRKPIDYSKGLIYKIESNGTVYYVGSTTDFTRRKSQHKTTCNNPKDKDHNSKIYKFIRENGGWDEFKMVLIENFKCNDSNELRAREQHWFNEFKPTLMNDNCPARTMAQYRLDNKIEISIKKAKYREDNKEEIAIKKAKYSQDNKEKISMQRAKLYQEKKARKLQLNNEIV